MIEIAEISTCFVCRKIGADPPNQASMAMTILDGGEEEGHVLLTGEEMRLDNENKTAYLCNDHLQQVVVRWSKMYMVTA